MNEELFQEKSPPGFSGTVKAMKKHPELTKGETKDGKKKNPFALAWYMHNKGYESHYKDSGKKKEENLNLKIGKTFLEYLNKYHPEILEKKENI